MTKTSASICAVLLAFAATSTYASDAKKAEPAKTGASAPASAVAGGANKPAAATAAEPKKEKKEKKGGC